MAESTGEADFGKCGVVKVAHDTQHGILFNELLHDSRIIEIRLAMLHRFNHRWRERVGIHL